MKKILPYLPLLFLLFGGCQPRQAPPQQATPLPLQTPDLIAYKTDTPLTIDGHLDEPIYRLLPQIELKNSMNTQPVSDPAYATYAYLCYDDSFFYASFMCMDKDIHSRFHTRDQRLWEEEAVEVFINLNADTANYIEIEVSPANVVYDSYIVNPTEIVDSTAAFNLQQLRTAVAIDGVWDSRADLDTAWSVEMAIPIAELQQKEGLPPQKLEESVWAINLFRLNLDDFGPRAFAWNPTKGSFHKPRLFGILAFRESLPRR